MLVHLKSDLIRQRIHAKEHAVSAPKKLKHSGIFNANHHTQSDVIMLDKENYYAPDSISPSPKPGMTRFFSKLLLIKIMHHLHYLKGLQL